MFLVTSIVIFVIQLILNLVLYRVVSAPIALVPRGGVDFILGVGVDDLGRPAATGAPAARLAVRTSAIG